MLLIDEVVQPQARRPENGSAEGSRTRTAGADHWERSLWNLPGKILHLFIFVKLCKKICIYTYKQWPLCSKVG